MFINEIKNDIPKLIEKYHTMGVNSFCEIFEPEYIIFADDFPPTRINENQTVITNLWWWQNKKSRTFERIKNHKKLELYVIEKEYTRFSDSTLKLHFWFHTPSIALNWAYLKGFKNVILAGIDLNFNDKRHFDANFVASWLNDDVKKARQHLEDVATKYLKIYQLNAQSDLRLEKITIKDLLCPT